MENLKPGQILLLKKNPGHRVETPEWPNTSGTYGHLIILLQFDFLLFKLTSSKHCNSEQKLQA